MNLGAAFDAVTKAVAAIGAIAVVYTFVTKQADTLVPIVLSVSGLAYLVVIALSGLCIVAFELFYWRGPVYRRPSHSYRLMLTRRSGRLPTRLEIVERSRRRDQVITLVLFLLCGAFLLAAVYFTMHLELSNGFPIESWSATWFSGSIALVAIAIVAGRLLWSRVSKGRTPTRKQRCPSCAELCPKQARRCSHCSEFFPAWRLLRPLDHDELRTLGANASPRAQL